MIYVLGWLMVFDLQIDNRRTSSIAHVSVSVFSKVAIHYQVSYQINHEDDTCNKILFLSKGDTHVLEMAPAIPPDIKCLNRLSSQIAFNVCSLVSVTKR